MLTSIRGLAAATVSVSAFALVSPAFAAEAGTDIIIDTASAETAASASPEATSHAATYGPVVATDLGRASEPYDAAAVNHQGEDGPFTFSANVAGTTDYRFRGVSLSGGDFALQGGMDIAHSSGFYVGTWASSIDGGPAYGEVELDLYGGWSGDLAEGVTLDVGLLYYLYPTEDIGANVNYWEPYASIGFGIGPAALTAGVAYAWDQDSLGGEDNLYLYTDAEFGIPNTPLTLNAHLGYTDGVLAPPLLAGSLDDTGFDYSVGASATLFGPISASVSYVGVDGPSIDGFTDDTVVFTLSAEF